MVFVLYSGTIQCYVEYDLKLARLSALISPYLGKFMKYNKSNTAFLCEIVITNSFVRGHLCNSLVQSNGRVIKVNSRCNNYSMNIDHHREKQYR